jgi:hypothetical protein
MNDLTILGHPNDLFKLYSINNDLTDTLTSEVGAVL